MDVLLYGVDFRAVEEVYYALDFVQAETFLSEDRDRILAAISDSMNFERMKAVLKDSLVASTARSAAQAGDCWLQTTWRCVVWAD